MIPRFVVIYNQKDKSKVREQNVRIFDQNTTVEERKKIVEESLGNISADCDGCMSGLAEMYQDYIEGKREIRDINMEFNARYVRGDMDKEERRSCPM